MSALFRHHSEAFLRPNSAAAATKLRSLEASPTRATKAAPKKTRAKETFKKTNVSNHLLFC